MFKDRDWKVLFSFGVLTLALSFWGFYSPQESFGSLLQKSIRLIRGTGEFSFDKDPWQLVVAQYLMPLMAIFVAGKVFLLQLRRDVRLAFVRKSRNHTIVCGLSDTGRSVVENLRAAGERVVAVDRDNTTAHATSIEHAGVPVIKGDATQARTLELAGLGRARAIVATSGSDPTNLEIAFRADDILRQRGARKRLQALVEMRTEWMFGAITNHERATLGSDVLELKPFNLHQSAARVMYRSPAFERRRCAMALRPSHLLLLGFGRMGSETVAHGIRTAFAVPGETPRFTIVDRAGAAAAESFFSAFPGIRDVAKLRFVECTVGDDVASWRKLEPLLELGDITAVIVTLPNDDLGLLAGMRIRNHLDRLKDIVTPVFTRLRSNHKLGQFASDLERFGPLRERFVPFGDLSFLTGRNLLFESGLDDLARAHHAAYLAATKGGDGAGGPADLPWERLPEIYKQSNRHFADHIEVKMRAAGLRLVPAAAGAQSVALSDAEVERLGSIEHWRWQVERRMAGWRHGAVRDDLRRLHPGLVDWAMLSEPVREQNRAAMRGLPGLLATAGLAIRREHIVSAVGADAAHAGEVLDAAGGAAQGEHLVIVIDPDDQASRAVGQRAAAGGASVWLLISDRLTTTLMSGDAGVLAARDSTFWGAVEGFIDAQELDCMRHSGRCTGKPLPARAAP